MPKGLEIILKLVFFFVFLCARQVKALLIFMLKEVITVLKLVFCFNFPFSRNCLFYARIHTSTGEEEEEEGVEVH